VTERVFLTGGTGFIGRRLTAKLRARGDEVVALVRDPSKAGALRELGCELVAGDVTASDTIRSAMAGCHAAIHNAGMYEVGIPSRERPAMFEANVRGTECVLDAAVDVGLAKIVYVSTVNVFGNTLGQVVDETYRRPPGDRYLTYYDETKFRAHQAALERVAKGAPVVIAQPGGVYGPNDHSSIGTMIQQAGKGSLRFLTFPDMGANFVYVDDAADGILLALEGGRAGESYVIGGEIGTLGDVLRRAARLSGQKAPRLTMPGWLVKLSIPLGPLVGKLMGQPPNLGELIRAADGVTYWATDAKARRELGYQPRDLDTGLRQTLA
jgi:nucleoside-diphosphate-sugar epimerase